MVQILPFQIAISDSNLDHLRKKVELSTIPDELDSSGWAYGVPLEDIKNLLNHWQTSYDWRKHEAKLNEIPQYLTKIQVDGFDPIDIHFIHQKSKCQNAIPLLFVHGWPGSFLEVTKILDKLTEGGPNTPAFHVVAPSLPNYGFSEGVKKRGFAAPQYATTCHKLMLALGYSQYATQGGDWGYTITRCIGALFPSHCRASHINMAVPTRPTFKSHPLLAAQAALTPLTAAEQAGLKRAAWFRREGSGYFKEQSTKPQTLGYSLVDSPVGLLAWIYEKLHDWTDAYPWTPDEVLTWISIYWFSRAGAAAASRIYYEVQHDRSWKPSKYVAGVKLGISYFPKELTPMPSLWHRTLGEVVFERARESGGHFAAWEKPDAIVADLREMFGRGGGAHCVVERRSGYDDVHPAKL